MSGLGNFYLWVILTRNLLFAIMKMESNCEKDGDEAVSDKINVEYYLTIVREGRISRAAEKLLLSQSYLSQYVSKLEQKLGVKLLERTKTPLEITKAGKIYYDYLENWKQTRRKLEDDLYHVNKDKTTVLHIGLSPWRSSCLLPDVLPLFYKKHPNAEVVVHEYPVREMYSMVSRGNIEFSIMNAPALVPEFCTMEALFYENIILVGHKDNPKTFELIEAIKQDNTEALKIIENEFFILLEKRLTIADIVANYLEKVKVYPMKKMFTSNDTTSLNMVSATGGFCFFLDSGVPRASIDKNLVFINLQTPSLIVPVSVLQKKGTILSLLASDFIECVKEYYKDYALPVVR